MMMIVMMAAVTVPLIELLSGLLVDFEAFVAVFSSVGY